MVFAKTLGYPRLNIYIYTHTHTNESKIKVTSALVGTPLELIMIQQQRKGGSAAATVKSVLNADIGRGFVGCAVREGLWTCGYLSIPPIIRTQLREKYPDTFDSDNKARVPAALLGGLFACYLTQPFDTIKTCMQGE